MLSSAASASIRVSFNSTSSSSNLSKSFRRLNLRLFKVKRLFSSISMTMSSSDSSRNKLQFERSPYLVQHRGNPVKWYPWGAEAWDLAKRTKKPIFLSVGYSTCHWCHVMEHESFENQSIADLMNNFFVNIKVDREERPDTDRIYMTFIQAISGSGGWPMSVWLTPPTDNDPGLKPFYGGTYYPPSDSYGRPGFRSLITLLDEQWREEPQKFIDSANNILAILKKSSEMKPSAGKLMSVEIRKKCFEQLSRSFEPVYGGFSDHPKFPQPSNCIFLIYESNLENIRLHKANSEDENKAMKMISKTLKCMTKGGIHDHIGFGFSRYSTDRKWHVPHFEKMLYDQAQLVAVFANAYLVTKENEFRDTLCKIIEYVDRDLSHPEGGFYSGEDADSYPEAEMKKKDTEKKVKKEGAFYAWLNEEIEKILDGDDIESKKLSEIFSYRYGVKPKGNVDPYQDPHDELKFQNVLFLAHTLEETKQNFKLESSIEDIENALNEAREKFFNYRVENRPRPHLDSKFVTSWNGLMISGYAQAGKALGSEKFIQRAEKAMSFVEKYMMAKPTSNEEKGTLLYRTSYRSQEDRGEEKDQVISTTGEVGKGIYGCVDDYANIISALIDLYEATLKHEYITRAFELQAKQDELFLDTTGKNGGYFMSRGNDTSVIVRMKDDDDGAEPSSNSKAIINLIRLEKYQTIWNTSSSNCKQKAELTLNQFGDRLSKIPVSLPLMASTLPAFRNSIGENDEILKIYIFVKSMSESSSSKMLNYIWGSMPELIDVRTNGFILPRNVFVVPLKITDDFFTTDKCRKFYIEMNKNEETAASKENIINEFLNNNERNEMALIEIEKSSSIEFITYQNFEEFTDNTNGILSKIINSTITT